MALNSIRTLLLAKALLSQAMQLGILRVIIQIFRDTGIDWILDDTDLLNALTIMRMLVEVDDQACNAIAMELDFLMTLARCMCCCLIFIKKGDVYNNLK